MRPNLQYFNSHEAANILNVNVSSIKRWTEEGKLECIKTAGGHRKFTIQHLTNYLKEHKSKIAKANLFPIESDEDLKISSHILKGDFDFLIDFVSQQSLLCNRDRNQWVFNGLYMGQFPLHEIYDKLITPVLHRNGDLWEMGEINVIQEHFSTQIIRDCLIRLQGIIQIPAQKIGTAFCLTMSNELHDMAIKMIDHILEQRGYKILFSGQMMPSLGIEKIFERFRPQRVYISSTVISDLNTAQAEFDKICYISSHFGAKVFVGGRGFDRLQFNLPAVEKRLYNFKEVFFS